MVKFKNIETTIFDMVFELLSGKETSLVLDTKLIILK